MPAQYAGTQKDNSLAGCLFILFMAFMLFKGCSALGFVPVFGGKSIGIKGQPEYVFARNDFVTAGTIQEILDRGDGIEVKGGTKVKELGRYPYIFDGQPTQMYYCKVRVAQGPYRGYEGFILEMAYTSEIKKAWKENGLQ
jgi:hypothetical protein